jgi:hypothetical protein
MAARQAGESEQHSKFWFVARLGRSMLRPFGDQSPEWLGGLKPSSDM